MTEKNLSGTQQARLDEAAFEQQISTFEKDIVGNSAEAEQRVKSLWNKRYHCIQRKKMAAEVGLKDTQPFTKKPIIPKRLEKFEDNLRLRFPPEGTVNPTSSNAGNPNSQNVEGSG